MAPQADSEHRTDPRRARSSAALIEAANRLFAEHGFADTTVEQIASEAGVAIGTLYGNFGDKRGLYLAAIDHALGLNDEYQLPIFRSDLSPAQKIAASGAAYVRFYAEHPLQFKLIQLPVLEAGDGPLPEALVAIEERVDRIIELMASTLAEGAAAGEIRKVAPVPAARFLWASLTGAIALNLRPGLIQMSKRDVAEVVRAGFAITTQGLVGHALRQPDGTLAPEADDAISGILTAAMKEVEV